MTGVSDVNVRISITISLRYRASPFTVMRERGSEDDAVNEEKEIEERDNSDVDENTTEGMEVVEKDEGRMNAQEESETDPLHMNTALNCSAEKLEGMVNVVVVEVCSSERVLIEISESMDSLLSVMTQGRVRERLVSVT